MTSNSARSDDGLGDAAVGTTVLAVTVSDDQNGPRRDAAPPPALQRQAVCRSDFDVAEPRLARCRSFARGHRRLRPRWACHSVRPQSALLAAGFSQVTQTGLAWRVKHLFDGRSSLAGQLDRVGLDRPMSGDTRRCTRAIPASSAARAASIATRERFPGRSPAASCRRTMLTRPARAPPAKGALKVRVRSSREVDLKLAKHIDSRHEQGSRTRS